MEKPLHLYRHLIRYAHNLYDDVACTYISRYIRLRFETLSSVKDYRLRKALKEGRRGLSVLKRANAGAYPALSKVLELSYGRTGRRRHELLKPILEYPMAPTQPLIAGRPRSAPPAISPPLEALLKWNPEIKSVTPIIPKTNNWGRPFPKCREANLRWRHLTKNIKKTPAPLSLDQRTRLECLALGLETPVPGRRKVPLKVEMPERLTAKTLGRPRHMSLRSKRRMWKGILSQTPAMNYNREKERWEVLDSQIKNSWVRPVGDFEEFEGWTPVEVAKRGKKVK